MSKKNQHVIPYQGNWAVKGGGNSKVTKICPTQAEAIKTGTRISKNQESELLIHGQNGKIREKNSFGNDPLKIKG